MAERAQIPNTKPPPCLLHYIFCPLPLSIRIIHAGADVRTTIPSHHQPQALLAVSPSVRHFLIHRDPSSRIRSTKVKGRFNIRLSAMEN